MKKELNSIVASNVVSLSPLQEYQSSDILSIASLLKGIANDKMNVFCKILMSKNPMFIDVSVHSQRNKIEKIMDELLGMMSLSQRLPFMRKQVFSLLWQTEPTTRLLVTCASSKAIPPYALCV